MPPRRRLLLATALLVLLLGGGTAWFALVEGFGPLDALYQVVITVSTVGFSEVHPLDASGRVFTIVLILGGIGVWFYVASAVVEELMLGRVAEAFGVRRWHRRIHRMHDHYMICGFGRVGEAVAEELKAHGVEIVILDEDEARVALARDRGLPALAGDATNEALLLEAHADTARVMIVATESDAENTFIALTARALNPEIFIVAVARSDAVEPRLRAAGVNRVFQLHHIAGRRIALAAVQPMVVDFLDTISRRRPDSLTMLAELVVEDEAAALAGRTLAQCFASLRSTRVLGLERADGELLVGPGGDTELRDGDRLMLYGDQREIEQISAENAPHGASFRAGAAAGDGPASAD